MRDVKRENIAVMWPGALRRRVVLSVESRSDRSKTASKTIGWVTVVFLLESDGASDEFLVDEVYDDVLSDNSLGEHVTQLFTEARMS